MILGYGAKDQGHTLCVQDVVGTIQTTVFARSLSNFTCKLFMMRGGTLLIWGHKVKFQGQLWPPARGCHALRCLVTLEYIPGIDHILTIC